nr:MAG TPA: hypothetical protein [Caudoviricetes sp.]
MTPAPLLVPRRATTRCSLVSRAIFQIFKGCHDSN